MKKRETEDFARDILDSICAIEEFIKDKLIHHYFGVDMEVLWLTATENVPRLKVLISRVIMDMEKGE